MLPTVVLVLHAGTLAGPGSHPPRSKVKNMQLASIPKTVLAANQRVATKLADAHEITSSVQERLQAGTVPRDGATELAEALKLATFARDGGAKLGARNLLADSFHRYATHAVRDISQALVLLERPTLSADGLDLLTSHLFNAEVSTRLGSQAAERSLAAPKLITLDRASSSHTTGDGSSVNTPAWVDGQWLDGLGNPVRGGGDSWTGPDGQSFGPDGSPVSGDGGGFTGPDGATYSGI